MKKKHMDWVVGFGSVVLKVLSGLGALVVFWFVWSVCIGILMFFFGSPFLSESLQELSLIGYVIAIFSIFPAVVVAVLFYKKLKNWLLDYSKKELLEKETENIQ